MNQFGLWLVLCTRDIQQNFADIKTILSDGSPSKIALKQLFATTSSNGYVQVCISVFKLQFVNFSINEYCY